MPAGNDLAAHAEFRTSVESQYGPYANAEEMMRAHAAGVDPGVRRAGLTQIDPAATDEWREKGIDKVEKEFKDVPEGWELSDFAVRGNALVGVFVDEGGIHHKLVTGANKRYKEAALDPGEAALRAQNARDAGISREVARLRAEADQRIAEAAEKENERVAKEIAKIREQADKDLAAEQKRISGEKSGSGGSGSGGSSPGGPAKSGSGQGGPGASASAAAGGKGNTGSGGGQE